MRLFFSELRKLLGNVKILLVIAAAAVINVMFLVVPEFEEYSPSAYNALWDILEEMNPDERTDYVAQRIAASDDSRRFTGSSETEFTDNFYSEQELLQYVYNELSQVEGYSDYLNSIDQSAENMKTLYHNVLVLDSGARGATTTFAENGQGDVLIAWENEAFLSLEEHPGEYEIVVSSVSILCQPTVALVDEVVDDRGTRDAATEYLQYLYSKEAQKLEAENFYRPSDPDVFSDYISTSGERVITELPVDGKWIVDDITLTDIAHFGGWSEASAKHFADGGVFDAIYEQ